MDVLRTPDDRFADLPGYTFAPHYVEAAGIRVYYLDEGPELARVTADFIVRTSV